jgi:hypothetical protein
VWPEASCEVCRLRHVGDEKIGVAEFVGDVPDRHFGADEAARMNDRPQLRLVGDAERQCVLGVGMNDRHDIGSRGEDRGMDEAFEIEAGAAVAQRTAVEV